MFLWVARIQAGWQAGKAELAPETAIADDEKGVTAGESEELRSDAELREGDLGEHGGFGRAASDVARIEEERIGREDLDEAERRGRGEEGGVEGGERAERDAVWREESEEGVERVVEESGGEETANGGD